MITIVVYTGDKTSNWKKDFCFNFFSRIGYWVIFEQKTYLINGLEFNNEKKPEQKYIDLFNYCFTKENISQSRLQKLRIQK